MFYPPRVLNINPSDPLYLLSVRISVSRRVENVRSVGMFKEEATALQRQTEPTHNSHFPLFIDMFQFIDVFIEIKASSSQPTTSQTLSR